MNTHYKKSLIEAAEIISYLKYVGICSATFFDLSECPEFMAFNPFKEKNTNYYWWKDSTMDDGDTQDDIQNARLIAIAFMITMPKDMVPNCS